MLFVFEVSSDEIWWMSRMGKVLIHALILKRRTFFTWLQRNHAQSRRYAKPSKFCAFLLPPRTARTHFTWTLHFHEYLITSTTLPPTVDSIPHFDVAYHSLLIQFNFTIYGIPPYVRFLKWLFDLNRTCSSRIRLTLDINVIFVTIQRTAIWIFAIFNLKTAGRYKQPTHKHSSTSKSYFSSTHIATTRPKKSLFKKRGKKSLATPHLF